MDAAQRANIVKQAESHFNSGQHELAETIAREVLASFPNCPQSLQVIGLVQASARQTSGHQVETAIETLEKTLSIQSDLVPAQNYLGMMHAAKGDLDTAMACYRRAIRLQPDHANARFNRALLLLKTGQFAEGWTEYEWRWKATAMQRPAIPVPRWNGESLDGRSILVHTEQGIGDTLQFARFLPRLKQMGATVWFACPNRLRPLLAQIDGIDHWMPVDEPAPIQFDVYSPLLSLPVMLGIDHESDFCFSETLVAPELPRVERWRSRLDALPGLKVGIGWQGSPTFVGDHWRSINLDQFAPLGQIANVSWISLQQQVGSPQPGDDGPFPMGRFENVDADAAFVDSLAIMHGLDLVITSDTALAHVAGSAGVPVWVLLSTASDWRWQVRGANSPWYPTMKLYRQEQLGNWGSVMSKVAADLATQVATQDASR